MADTPLPRITPEQVRAIRGEESQQAFAVRLHTTNGTVWRWENGQASPNLAGTAGLRALAEARGVDLG